MGIILISASVTMFLCVAMLLQNANKAFEKNLFEVAESVTKSPEVLQALREPPAKNGVIQERMERMIDSFAYIDMIVVCNMKGERYSHPDTSLIGVVYRDMETAGKVKRGEQFISGTYRPYGYLIRSFTPIFDGQEQLGFVVVSAVGSKLEFERQQIYSASALFLIIGLGIGTICALRLSKKIKAMLLGMEPDDLARLYREHTGMVEAMHEGVVAVDNSGAVRMMNESARTLLGVGGEEPLGREIAALLPDTHFSEVITSGLPVVDQEQRVNEKIVVANIVPIVVKDRTVGAVGTLLDKTQVIRMAEELTGVSQLVDAFRARSHEFSNKLHALSGMLQMGDYDNAKRFIIDTSKRQDDLQSKLMAAFKEPMLAGLLLGKFSYATEQRVSMDISPNSYLGPINNPTLSHELVTIIGNLVDNAIESCHDTQNAAITMDIRDEENTIAITVVDNGPGIREDTRISVFTRGFSTKGKGRGTGLYLVRQSVKLLGGEINLQSRPGWTEFTVSIPKSNWENT